MNIREATLRKTILEIVKASLFSIEPDIPENVDWEAVYHELIRQGVVGMSNDILPYIDWDKDFVEKWETTLLSQIRHYIAMGQEQNEIMAKMASNNIDAVIIKGTAASQYYPIPEYRQMGDIDIIVAPNDFESAKDTFYEMKYGLVEDIGRHMAFRKNGEKFELHRYFTLRDDTNISNIANGLIYEKIHESKWITSADITFPVLPDLENGLVLLLHMSQHMEEGVGLRHIADWIMFANAKLDNSLWNESFEAAAEKLGLKTIAITVTRMGQLFLGLPTKNMEWCMEADENLCRDLMNQIFICGNFTRKQVGKVANAVIYVKETGFFRNLQNNGIQNWKTCQEHKWMQPFAWIYQIGHYVNKYRHPDTFSDAVKGMQNVKERSKVLASLEIGHLYEGL